METISIKQACELKGVTRATIYNNKEKFTWSLKEKTRIVCDQKFADYEKQKNKGRKNK